MAEETLSYSGRCNICGSENEYRKEGRSIRETYLCHSCHSSLRYRGQAEAILKYYGPPGATSIAELVQLPSVRALSVFEPGLIGPFRKYFSTLPGYRQSFFWPDVPRGATRDGVECQDLMALTYPDHSVDLVVTSDIFEHIRRPYAAFQEIRRVLKPGGRHIFSIPVTAPMPARTFFRVDTSGDEDIYLVEPRYHGDGKGGRSLVYTDFGADMLDELARIGLPTEALKLDVPYLDLRKLLTFVSVKQDAVQSPQPPASDRVIAAQGYATPAPAAVSSPTAAPVRSTSLSAYDEAPARSTAYCNICGRTEFGPGPGGRMSQTGLPPKCLHCKSMERHRVVRKVFAPLVTDEFSLFNALQFSKDISIRNEWFGQYEISVYGETNTMDLQAIARPDESYDVVICNHVLEHVADDRAALGELFRIISPRGFILITVPNPLTNRMTRDWGYPDEKRHGHYRIYGADIMDLFRAVIPQSFVHGERDTDPATGTEDIVYFIAKSETRFAYIRERLEQARLTRNCG